MTTARSGAAPQVRRRKRREGGKAGGREGRRGGRDKGSEGNGKALFY